MKFKPLSLGFFCFLVLLSACVKDNEPNTDPSVPPVPAKENMLKAVIDYRPAIGQWVNELPKYADGDGQAEMNAKVLKALQEHELVTLGGFGGYLVLEFDRPITNAEGYDFKIFGNAFAGSSEAGIVCVANDDNANGKPDDEEWCELKGSAYDLPTTIKKYSITYGRWTFAIDGAPETYTGCAWTDNQGEKGQIYQNSYHEQVYYPLWIEQDGYTLSGTRLEPRVKKVSESITMLEPFEWGYVDNYPNANQDGNSFDIANAVDGKGQSKKLKDAKWIKVYTAINRVLPRIGEVSTEITSVKVLTK